MGGILSVSVRDAQTAEPVPSAQFRLSRRDKPTSDYLSSIDEDRRFTLALPTRDFVVQVMAPGYRSWESWKDRRRVPTGSILLAAGQSLTLDVALSR